MIIVISPSKSLHSKPLKIINKSGHPEFLLEAEKIASVLKKKKPAQLARLMDISPKLAKLNYARFQEWKLPFVEESAWQSLLMFNGDVYLGLQAETFNNQEYDIAQNKLRILSGLYGILKPYDVIMPYRLEMGTDIKIGRKKNLYEFWKTKITAQLNEEINEKEHKFLINLASNEYFSAIDKKKLNARIITPAFKEFKEGKYQMISFYAKKARGMMSRFIIKNNVSDPEELKAFDYDGYYFNNQLSDNDNWIFTR